MKDPKLSIIITNHNNGDYLDLCLNSLLKSTNLDDKEIIVFNDNCSDNTSLIAKKYLKKSKKISFLNTNITHGLAMASNIACSYANGEWLMITNEDVIFPPGWEEIMNKYMIPENKNDFFCPNVMEPGRYVPVAEGFIKKDFGNTAKEFDYKGFVKFEKKERSDKKIKAGNGPQFISKALYMKVGGCDPLFRGVPLVDTDFFIKLRLNGTKFMRTYEWSIYHFSGKGGRLKGDATTTNPQFDLTESDNMKKFISKWGFFPYTEKGLWSAPNKIIRGVDFSKLKHDEDNKNERE